MKLQFKEQAFQLCAVKAVVDIFAGQTLQTGKFTLERTKDILRKAKNAETGLQSIAYEEEINESIGYRNRAISITEAQVLQNILCLISKKYGMFILLPKPREQNRNSICVVLKNSKNIVPKYISAR